MVNPLSQRNPQWANELIDVGPNTIGQVGCAITCLCMMLQNYDTVINPDELNHLLLTNNGYDGFEDVVFNAFANLFGLTFLGRDYVVKENNPVQLITPGAAIQRINASLRLGQWALLRVRLGSTVLPNHFVLAVQDLGGDYQVADPWTGDVVSFKSRYGDPQKEICGIVRFFSPKVVEAPDGDLTSVAFKAYRLANNPSPDESRTYPKEIFNDLLAII